MVSDSLNALKSFALTQNLWMKVSTEKLKIMVNSTNNNCKHHHEQQDVDCPRMEPVPLMLDEELPWKVQ
ncbi:hypothetical protein DPMN_107081 [Dreissena polymorpha]|uniref:Uncharacterized protein n=1 Tax=Dreissena polymorpha TaxID=45954 RepID=A0A9D4K636_DREPO|nr:hypothetical protein DPMN_107081 [Dreissena polymorpha]